MSVLGKIVSSIDSAKQNGNKILNQDEAEGINSTSGKLMDYTLPENSVWKVEESSYKGAFNVLSIEGIQEISLKINGRDVPQNEYALALYISRKDDKGKVYYYLNTGDNKAVLSLKVEYLDLYHPYEDSFTITDLVINGVSYPPETISYKADYWRDPTLNVLPTVKTIKSIVAQSQKN